MILPKEIKIKDVKQTCGVCHEKPSNPDLSKGSFICDECEHDFKCMTGANDGWGKAWYEFEKANPDKICTECMNCGEWVALKEINEDVSCPRCGGDLYDEDD